MQGISVSRVKLYEECPRKYRYQYIDKLPQKKKSYFILGSFVHKVLERCIRYIISGDNIKDAMRSAFQHTRQDTPVTDVMLQELKPWLRDFMQTWNSDGAVPMKAEANFNFVLEDRFRVRGIIDRIDRNGDEVHVIDYKTSRSAQRLDEFQLAVYGAALRRGRYPKEPIVAWFSMVRFGFKQQKRMLVSDKHIEQALQRLYDAGEKIEQEQEWLVNRTFSCQFCDFFQQCFTESPAIAWS